MTDRVNMRMVGVPEKAFGRWALKLIEKGYKVSTLAQPCPDSVAHTCGTRACKCDRARKWDRALAPHVLVLFYCTVVLFYVLHRSGAAARRMRAD